MNDHISNYFKEFISITRSIMTDYLNSINTLTNAFGNPMIQEIIKEKSGLSGLSQQYPKVSKLFAPEVRQYFNIDTQTVIRKITKLMIPFKKFEWDDEIKKLDLYIPTISLMTLILFSTISEGILQEKQGFTPNIGKKVTWILIFSCIEILLARCTENVISHLNIGFIELTALVSYRFVPISVITLQQMLIANTIPYVSLIFIIYVLIIDVYFCKIELTNYAQSRGQQQGFGSKIGLGVHFLNTIAILWLCNLLY